ncbi:unnamed protein product [Gordionus sp. m RMFG-2023]|uniref:retinol dehydrogenase 14-like n=1 Tax=Gordionus sp. m RMFG-2023 TaxID=3053472 RepID=UPI0030E5A869
MLLKLTTYTTAIIGVTISVFILIRQFLLSRNRDYCSFILKNLQSSSVTSVTRLLRGRTVIVTGANSGIGRSAALQLAKLGARVVLACRNMDKANEARVEMIQEIKKELLVAQDAHDEHCDNSNQVTLNGTVGSSILGQNVARPKIVEYQSVPDYPEIVVKRLDLSDLASVRSFAKGILATEARCDILVNNGGLMHSKYSCTEQGHEKLFGTNHLGHFYLTLLLLPLLQRTAEANKKDHVPESVDRNSERPQEIDEGLRQRSTTDSSPLDSHPSEDKIVFKPEMEGENKSTRDLGMEISNNTCSRIVVVASAMHKYGKLDFDDINLTKGGYNYWKVYSASKLANILFTNELAWRLKTGEGLEDYLPNPAQKNADSGCITVNSLHPGIVVTGMNRNIDTFDIGKWLFNKFGTIVFKNPYQGSQTTMYCALAPELEGVSGKYFGDCEEHFSSPKSHDSKMAKLLWDYSMDCVRKFEKENS